MQIVVRRVKLTCALVGVLSALTVAFSATGAEAGLTTDTLGVRSVNSNLSVLGGAGFNSALHLSARSKLS